MTVVQDRAANQVSFYVDGEPHGQVSGGAVALPAVSGDAWLGTYDGSGDTDYLLDGALADVRWFRRALTGDQVRSLAQP